MEKMTDLKDLLRHEIEDLMSAEDQMIEALPGIAEKANNSQLKKALRDHLRVTEQQRKRLDEVQKLLEPGEQASSGEGESKGLFARLFGGGGHKCKGMEGLITEGEKVMGEDMNPEVLDAAIIACAQKMEHYEITGYGTAKAYARELNLREVERLLDQTLNEEYDADDLLTMMAVGKSNMEAEGGRSRSRSGGSSSRSAGSSGGSSSRSSSNRSSGGRNSSGSSGSGGSSKSSGGGRSSGGSSKGSSKSSGGGRNSGGSSKGSSKSSGGGRSSGSSSSKSSGGRSGGSSKSKSSGGRSSGS